MSGPKWHFRPRHNYAHIFDLLTSLRRAVDHPYLIVYGGGQASGRTLLETTCAFKLSIDLCQATHKLPAGKALPAANCGSVCGLCQAGLPNCPASCFFFSVHAFMQSQQDDVIEGGEEVKREAVDLINPKVSRLISIVETCGTHLSV